ncbi:hypothetical protein AB3S75_038399 [Citrus x aurantiifolia]
MTMIMWLPLLLIPLLLILKSMKKSQKQKLQQQLPPGPPKLPILGNLLQLGELPHQSLWKLSKKYGPVMHLKLGRIPYVVVSSAETAREVLKVHDLECCGKARLTGVGKLSYNYLDVAFAPYGDHWRQMRKLCVMELFSHKRVQSFQFIREEEVASLVNSISLASSSASPVDLSQKIFALSGSILFRVAFGKRFQGSHFDNHKFHELLAAAMAVGGSFTSEECFPYVGWIIDRFSGYQAKIESVFQEVDSFLGQVIEDHLKAEGTKQEHEDIVDVMLRIKREQAQSAHEEEQLTTDHIKAVLVDLLLAGVDTSAVTVIWAMSELARNPRVMSKARDEVRKCIGKNGSITEDNMEQLHYLKMIIKETFRLHPPGPMLLPRQTISHCKINGYDVNPETLLQVNVWAIGRDSRYWSKAEEFFPERFIDNSVDFKGQNFELLPFGGGRRICPGIQMGISTVELALANLLYHFNWKLPNGMEGGDLNMEEAIGQSLTTSKKTPLMLVPINYSHPK